MDPVLQRRALPAVGLTDPVTLYRQDQWTWEEFETIGRKLLVDRSGAGYTDTMGHYRFFFSPTNPYTRQAMMMASGGRIYNPELTRYYLDEVPNIQALQWLADLRELIGWGLETGTLGMNTGWPSAQVCWARTITFEFGAAPLPRPKTGTHATIMTTNILSVMKTSKNPGAAVRYINHICGTEVQRRRIDDNYVVSARGCGRRIASRGPDGSHKQRGDHGHHRPHSTMGGAYRIL